VGQLPERKLQDGRTLYLPLQQKRLALHRGNHQAQAAGRLQRQAAIAKDGEVKTTIVIRADLDTDYATIYGILKDCKTVGFRKLKLRAFKAS
jgi:biopolymer transport protein ExbD